MKVELLVARGGVDERGGSLVRRGDLFHLEREGIKKTQMRQPTKYTLYSWTSPDWR